mgnify:CR=1 FL=1
MAEEIEVEESELGVPQEGAEPESEPETAETSDQSEEADGSSNEVEEIKSERGKNRVQELANKAKELEGEKEELENRIAELEPLVVKTPAEDDLLKQIEDFSPQLSGDYESDIRTVEERATKKAITEIRKEQAKKDALIADVMICEELYPELRKDSDKYDDKLSSEIVSFYTELRSANPNIRLKPVVDRLMRLKGYAANKSKTEVAQSISQQESEGATTPSNNLTSNKEAKDLSLEEIERMVGTASD